MALTAKVRGQWRVVSKAMARRFRARGIQVVETLSHAAQAFLESEAELARKRLEDQMRASIRLDAPTPAEMLPAFAITNPGPRVEVETPAQAAARRVPRATVRKRVEVSRAGDFMLRHPPGVDAPKIEWNDVKPADLTDEELERLTAPDGGEG